MVSFSCYLCIGSRFVYMASSASESTEWKAGRVSIVLGGDGRGPAPLISYSALGEGGDDERELA